MHKLMCTFMTPMKKKIPDRNLDTSCPAGIPCNYITFPPQIALDDISFTTAVVKRNTLKDGSYFCYCAYVLRISRYSGFLWVVPTNTGILVRGLKLCGESRT